MKHSGTGFYCLLQMLHQIPWVDMLLGYMDIHGDLLPINNDDNYYKALSSANPLLRVIIQKKGKQDWEKGDGSVLHIKRHELQYHCFQLWAAAGAGGHAPSSYHFGGGMWQQEVVAPGGSQSPDELWHPCGSSPSPSPR